MADTIPWCPETLGWTKEWTMTNTSDRGAGFRTIWAFATVTFRGGMRSDAEPLGRWQKEVYAFGVVRR